MSLIRLKRNQQTDWMSLPLLLSGCTDAAVATTASLLIALPGTRRTLASCTIFCGFFFFFLGHLATSCYVTTAKGADCLRNSGCTYFGLGLGNLTAANSCRAAAAAAATAAGSHGKVGGERPGLN